MSRKEKLIQKLIDNPQSFTFADTGTLLGFFGFRMSAKGKTSGSRVAFISEKYGVVLLHRPHPGNELKAYQVKALREKLEQEGLI